MDTTIGVPTRLDRWTGKEWIYEFLLLKGIRSEPPTYARSDERLFYPNVGLLGGMAWKLKIPDGIRPGRYRLRESVSRTKDPSNEVFELGVQFDITK